MEAEIKKLQDFYWSDADPDGRGFVNLADAYRKGGDPVEALRILRDGLRRHPDLASGHVVMGWAHVQQAETLDAEAAFRAALALDPENVAALRGLGEILSRKGDSGGALETLKTLVKLDPLDRSLPLRVEELAATSPGSVPDEAGPMPLADTQGTPRLWDDPDDVAEELDWESAALQEDQSQATEGREEPEDGEAGGETEIPDSSVSADALKDDTLVTKTMAEIFLRQGLLGQAEQVLEQLLERDPQDEEVTEKLEHIRSLIRGEIAGEAFGARSLVETPRSEDIVPIEELTAEVILSIQELAPDRIIPIDELGPELVVPIDALAPGSETGDPTLDAFEAWLDDLP